PHSDETKKLLSAQSKERDAVSSLYKYQFRPGHVPWNAGLTKENDSRVMKVSKKLSGENNPMFGKYGEDHPLYGFHHTEESKAKISDAKRGRKHPLDCKHCEALRKKVPEPEMKKVASNKG
ncbi:hypothetical protein LCGC14_2740790, partial [marine sediment metagenome]